LKNTELDYTEIHFDEHKFNYTFIRFTQTCLIDPTMRFYSYLQHLTALTKSHTFAHSHAPYS